MNTIEFEKAFEEASESAKRFLIEYLSEPLPEKNLYHVFLNMSNDDHHKDFEIVYIEDDGVYKSYLSKNETLEMLRKEAGYPVWINISVCGIENGITHILLECAGRYVSDYSKHFMSSDPFNICVPIEIDEATGKRRLIFRGVEQVLMRMKEMSHRLVEAKRERGWGLR